MNLNRSIMWLLPILMCTVTSCKKTEQITMSGNPLFEGWYADPEAIIYDDTYWIYPTYSDAYEKQVFFDCFSSKDLVNWIKHSTILDTVEVKWAYKDMWAPSVIRKNDKYYFFFSANGLASDDQIGGIGVAVADKPEGPYKDLLGKPLISKIVNGAQPIDQFVFYDEGVYYMYYGGWQHCNVVKLNDDFKDCFHLRMDLIIKRSLLKSMLRALLCLKEIIDITSCGLRGIGEDLNIVWLMPFPIHRLARLNV